MAPPSSTLAWRIPGTGEPDRLQCMGSLRVGHNWATSLWLFTFMRWRRKWQPTPVFLPGESQVRGSLVAAVCGVAQSRPRLKRLSSSSSSVVVGEDAWYDFNFIKFTEVWFVTQDTIYPIECSMHLRRKCILWIQSFSLIYSCKLVEYENFWPVTQNRHLILALPVIVPLGWCSSHSLWVSLSLSVNE